MTTRKRTLYSDLAIPPGETLAEELEARGMTQKELAMQMKRPPQVVNEIIRAKKAITPETALDLERVFGVSAQFWLNLEADYQLTLARNRQRERSVAETTPANGLRQQDLKLGPKVAEEAASYGVDADD